MEPRSKPKVKLCKFWKFTKDVYKLVCVLGTGTYGQVIHAIHRETKKKVAIKFI